MYVLAVVEQLLGCKSKAYCGFQLIVWWGCESLYLSFKITDCGYMVGPDRLIMDLAI